MPKDEFDFEDPFELNGMVFPSQEDSTLPMAECFIEEFMRMGYGPGQLLGLFRNPHYVGPHLAYQKQGEPRIRGLITEVFARWGKAVQWPDEPVPPQPGSAPVSPPHSEGRAAVSPPRLQDESPTAQPNPAH